MGRWLNKIIKKTNVEVPKGTKGTFGPFGPDDLELLSKNTLLAEQQSRILAFVKRAIKGFPIDPKTFIDEVLGVLDEQDILKGEMTFAALQCAAENWRKCGRPDNWSRKK